jgi:predicted HAD superfamily hydrolase
MDGSDLDAAWLDVGQGVEAELNTERKALRANPSVRSLVDEGRKKHGRVIFISDCYLSEEFLLEMLIEHGFFKDGDACYVSSATRKTKRDGSLFQHVLTTEGIAPKHLRHLGDDYVSDYIVPTRLGINAIHYANGVFTSVEKTILRQALKADFVVASQLVADMKFFRLKRSDKLSPEIAAIRDFAGSFIGPFLALFAAWVLSKAREDGVKRLYFLSRDCYALWLVASRVSHSYGGIECRYLYASRQAVLLPAVSEISPQGMPWIRRHTERATLKLLLSKVELDPMEASEGFAAWFNEVGSEYELSDEAEWRRFWSLLNEKPLRSRILELVRVRRDAALAYFRQEGLFDQAEVAIVDLGWRATGQAAIRTLLRSENSRMEVRGYYLGLSN